MPQISKNSTMQPDIKVIKQITAEMLTGDGISANTDLMKLPNDEWLIVNVIDDNLAHLFY